MKRKGVTHSFKVLKMSASPSPTGHIQVKTIAELDKESGWNMIRSEWSCPGILIKFDKQRENPSKPVKYRLVNNSKEEEGPKFKAKLGN